MLYWGLPVGLFVILLIAAFFEKVEQWVRSGVTKRKERKSQQVFDLYRKLQILGPEERSAYLNNHSKRVRRRYEYAVSLWGEPE